MRALVVPYNCTQHENWICKVILPLTENWLAQENRSLILELKIIRMGYLDNKLVETVSFHEFYRKNGMMCGWEALEITVCNLAVVNCIRGIFCTCNRMKSLRTIACNNIRVKTANRAVSQQSSWQIPPLTQEPWLFCCRDWGVMEYNSHGLLKDLRYKIGNLGSCFDCEFGNS